MTLLRRGAHVYALLALTSMVALAGRVSAASLPSTPQPHAGRSGGSGPPAAAPAAATRAKIIARLVAVLERDDHVDWGYAAEALAKVGAGDEVDPAIDRLFHVVDHGYEEDRAAAVHALGMLPSGKRHGAVVDKLVATMADDSKGVRSQAARYVDLTAPPPTDRVATVGRGLTLLLEDPDEMVRRQAAEALARLPSTAWSPVMAAKLADIAGDDVLDAIAQPAATIISSLPSTDLDQVILTNVLPHLADERASTRRSAVSILAGIDFGASGAGAFIDRLVPRLARGRDPERATTIDALAVLPARERRMALVRTVVPFLADGNGPIRAAASRAIGTWAAQGDVDDVVPVLLPLLSDDEPDVRVAAAQAFAKVGWGGGGSDYDEPQKVREQLSAMLDADNGRVVEAAAKALMSRHWNTQTMPIGAQNMIDKLFVTLMAKRGAFESVALIEAITTIPLDTNQRNVATYLMLSIAVDANAISQHDAIRALEKLTTRGQTLPVATALIGALGQIGSTDEVCEQALAILAADDHTGAVLELLIKQLDADTVDRRVAAVQTLAIVSPGDQAGAIVAALLPLLTNGQARVRGATARAFARVSAGGHSGEVTRKIAALMDDRDSDVRNAATATFAALTQGRSSVSVDKIVAKLDDPDPFMRQTAIQALATIAAATPQNHP